MRCEKCGVDMEKGYFAKSHWMSGEVSNRWKSKGMFGIKASFCIVWKCPHCKKLEFYCEE